jgi:hypothetical protein
VFPKVSAVEVCGLPVALLSRELCDNFGCVTSFHTDSESPHETRVSDVAIASYRLG